MPTSFPELFSALAAPFSGRDVKSRQAPGGQRLSYITARTVQNRLDEVCGPENWWASYDILSEHSVLCRLTLLLPDGRAVTKCDCGATAGMKDEGDDDKSGFSDAYKRAAIQWGVGRHLYGDGIPTFTSRPGTSAPALTPGATMLGYLERSGRTSEAVDLARPEGISPDISTWTDLECKFVAGLLRANTARRKAEAQVGAEAGSSATGEEGGESEDSPAPAGSLSPGQRMLDYLAGHARVREAQELARTAGIDPDISIANWTEAQCKVVGALLRKNASEKKAEEVGESEDSPAPAVPESLPDMPNFANGLAFFRWAKSRQEEHSISLVGYLNGWAREHHFAVPDKMLSWSQDEIRLGYAEAVRKIRSLTEPGASVPAPAPLSTVDSHLCPPSDLAPDPTPGYDAAFEASLRQMQESLLARCVEVRKIQVPGKKVDGPAIRLVVSCLAQIVGGPPLTTIRGCRDPEILADYLVAVEQQLDRLQRQAGPVLEAPAPAPAPSVLPFSEIKGVAG